MGEYTTKDSGERQQFASGMKRDVTEGKIAYHLIRSGPMYRRWAELMTRGAVKYNEDNWMKADSEEELERFKVSATRHFEQWFDGDDDEDHAAAVIFNMNGYEYVLDVLAVQEKVEEYPKPERVHWTAGPKCTACGLVAAYHGDFMFCSGHDYDK